MGWDGMGWDGIGVLCRVSRLQIVEVLVNGVTAAETAGVCSGCTWGYDRVCSPNPPGFQTFCTSSSQNLRLRSFAYVETNPDFENIWCMHNNNYSTHPEVQIFARAQIA